jgi:hypothetical protein
MSAPSEKIQSVVDENVHRVVTQMSEIGLRGKTVSEVVYKILEEWTWNNQEKLEGRGIYLTKKRLKFLKRQNCK